MILQGDLQPVSKHYCPHEWALAVLGFVMPLGASSQLTVLSSSGFRMVVAALTAFLVCVSLFGLSKEHKLSIPARYALPPAVVYMIVVSVATIRDDLPGVRYQLFAVFPLAVFGFYVAERYRPGSWLRIVYAASVGHLIMAVFTGSTRMAFGGVSRLEAGTSAVLLGFEAALVLVVSFWFMWNRRARFANFCIFLLAAYCLFAAFSRAAFVSALVGCGVVFIFWGRGRFPRFLTAAVVGVLTYSIVLPQLITFLSANDTESLYGASGRYRIWGNALAYFDEWFRGYGFTALYDHTGPDAELKAAVFDLPLENSLLEALFMAGIVGAVAWMWLYWRVVRVTIKAVTASRGLSLAMLATLSIGAFYSVGLSGVSYDWWWLLAAFSFVGSIQSTPPRPPKAAIRGRQPKLSPAYQRLLQGRNDAGAGARNSVIPRPERPARLDKHRRVPSASDILTATPAET